MVYSSIDRTIWVRALCAARETAACIPYYRRKRLVLPAGVLERECRAFLNEYCLRNPTRPYPYKLAQLPASAFRVGWRHTVGNGGI